MKKLAWGAGHLVPDDALAAWGARAIIQGSWSGGFGLDIPPDRISVVGDAEPKRKLGEKLVAVDAIKIAEGYLKQDPPQDEPVDIYEDSDIKVVGRLAGGYFYLAAYLKAPAPGYVLPRKGGEPAGSPAAAPVWLKLIRRVLSSEDKELFKLLEVGPGDDGQYREAYSGADVVFPSYDEEIVRVVPKSPEADAVILKALEVIVAEKV